MKTDISLKDAVNQTITAMQKSSDFSDSETISSIVILMDIMWKSPKEILTLDDSSLLAIALSSTISSDFAKNCPQYYNHSTGEFLCAVGFYAFMKQLEHGMMLNAHFPAFIVLLHEGREYMAELIEKALLSKVKSRSPYNPFFISAFNDAESKKYAIVKGIELVMHVTCAQKGYSDPNLQRWQMEIESEINDIKRLIGTDFFKYALDLYRFIAENLKSDTPYDFD